LIVFNPKVVIRFSFKFFDNFCDNTKYFHGSISSRRYVNNICVLDVRGAQVEGVSNVTAVVYNHFLNHFKAPVVERPELLIWIFVCCHVGRGQSCEAVWHGGVENDGVGLWQLHMSWSGWCKFWFHQRFLGGFEGGSVAFCFRFSL